MRVAVPAPADTRHAHLSWNKVLRTRQGTVLLACVAGTFHGSHGGGCPAVTRSKDNGQSFEKLQILREFGPGMDYTCCGNVALGEAPDGSLILLAMAYTGDEANHLFGWRSADDGVSWKPVDTGKLGPNLTGSVFGNILSIPGKGLSVMGHYRVGSSPHTQGIWLAHSADSGQSWSEARRISEVYAVEPVFLQAGERWVGFFRAGKDAAGPGSGQGRQFVASSDDQGQTWATQLSSLDAEDPKAASLAAPCAVANPNKPGEILVLTTERSRGKNQLSRIWLWRGNATDLEWKRERVLLEFPHDAKNNDLGYPWLLHQEGQRWQLYYYHGEKKGPNSIWVTEVTL